MNFIKPMIKILFASITALMLSIVLAGCPQPANPPQNTENLLSIPPLGTVFAYEGESLNWNLQPHPRILASPDSIEWLRAHPESDLSRQLLTSAQTFAELAVADPNFYEASAPLVWAWGYLLTDDEKYMQLVKGTLPALLKFPAIVKIPEGANIPFLYQAEALGGIYDLLYNKWTDDERAQIEKVLRETVFHTLAYKVTEYDRDINFWANDPDTNYYVTFHSTAGLAAIALAGVEPDAEALAEHCYTRIQESLHAFEAENGWREGLTYLDFCWGQFGCYFLLALENNTDLKPFDEEWLTDSDMWSMWGQLPDMATIADFGDNEPENYSVGSWRYRLGVLTGNGGYIEEAMRAGEAIANSGAPEEMRRLAFDLPIFEAMCLGRGASEQGNIPRMLPRPVMSYFPGIEWGFFRTGLSGEAWSDENDFYCAFKSGVAGYDHNHLDQGSMILAAYSEVLLSDPGRGGPDIIRQDPYLNCLFEAGLGHNTLIIGDGCYMDLGLFPDNERYFAKPGAFTSMEKTDQYLEFTTNNSGLYPTEPLTDYRRTFLFIMPGVVEDAELGVLILADRVAFYEDRQHSFLFHTPGQVENPETGVASFINEAARLDYYGFCTVPTVDKSEFHDTTWDIRNSNCYYRSTENAGKDSDWVHVLIPARTDSPATPKPVIRMNNFGISVTWPEYQLTLLLKPDIGWVYAEMPG